MRRMARPRVAIAVALAAVCSSAVLIASGESASGAGGGVATTTLTGANVVPPNASTGTGMATVTLDPTETSIKVDVTFSLLTGTTTAAHIHGPAAAGTNAAVVFTFAGFPLGVTSGTFSQASIPITATQVADLKAGLYYIDIHTSIFPGGELRGQLAFVASLTGPTTGPPATPTVIGPRFTG